MKTLFQAHTESNAKTAKATLIATLAATIGRYVALSETLNTTLVSASSNDCSPCSINKITGKMAKLGVQAVEIEKTYELLFNEKINSEKIAQLVTDFYYPLIHGEVTLAQEWETPWKWALSKDWSLPESQWGTPAWDTVCQTSTPLGYTPTTGTSKSFSSITGTPESSEIESLISDYLERLEVSGIPTVIPVKLTKNTSIYGVKPSDYTNFKSFYKAVQKNISEGFDMEGNKCTPSTSSTGKSSSTPSSTPSSSTPSTPVTGHTSATLSGAPKTGTIPSSSPEGTPCSSSSSSHPMPAGTTPSSNGSSN
jgi:hypothetical protein